MRFLSFLILVFLGTLNVNAQHTNLLLGNNYSSNFNHLIYNDNSDCHTSFKPIIKSNLNFDIDSVLQEKNISDYSNWYLRKLFSEHFIILKGEDYKVLASPIINLSKGKEVNEGKNTFANTRGFLIEGDLGKKISFFSSFVENQSVFPNYADNFIKENRGFVKEIPSFIMENLGFVREIRSFIKEVLSSIKETVVLLRKPEVLLRKTFDLLRKSLVLLRKPEVLLRKTKVLLRKTKFFTWKAVFLIKKS